MLTPQTNANIAIKRSRALPASKTDKASKLSLRLAFKQQQIQRVIDGHSSKPTVKDKVTEQLLSSKIKGCSVVLWPASNPMLI